MRRVIIILLLLLALAATGCSLLDGPQGPITLDPESLPLPPAVGDLEVDGEIVTDPVSDIVPTIDPAIEALLSEVSKQQLMGYIRALQDFGTRNAFSETQSETFGIGAARRWIFNEFVRVGNGRLQVEFQDFPLSYAGFEAPQSNVVATLPGTGEGEGTIVLVAHYDNRPADETDGFSRSTGANDNASGVALLLESARILSSREWSQDIVFLATSAEEQGTIGARYFAETAFFDGRKIGAVINYDAVGGRIGIPQHARLFAQDYGTSNSGALGRFYEFIAGMYLPTFPVSIIDALDREGRWGDHREFIRAGFPAIRVIESLEDPELVNSNLDTWDRIDYDYLQKMSQLNVAVVANLAGAPNQPPPPIIAPMAQQGSYLLSWPVAPDADGYAIAFRPAGSSDFPTFRFVRAEHAGNVAITGLDPNIDYGVSIAALTDGGMLGGFSPEVTIGPTAGVPPVDVATQN